MYFSILSGSKFAFGKGLGSEHSQAKIDLMQFYNRQILKMLRKSGWSTSLTKTRML